jgi:VanZ family protein
VNTPVLEADLVDDSPMASNIADWVLNLAGFVPFGFLLMAGWGSRERRGAVVSVLVVTLIGCALSLSVELLQVFLPDRFSQLSDLVLNTAGTLVGALLGRRRE